MEIFLAILMVLGIFIVVPAIIGFTYVAVVSGLFQVILDRLRRRIAAPRRARRILEEPVLREVTQ
jgi:hypothetical protein